MQHKKLMRRVILSSLTCLVLLHSSTLRQKRHEFRNKIYWI